MRNFDNHCHSFFKILNSLYNILVLPQGSQICIFSQVKSSLHFVLEIGLDQGAILSRSGCSNFYPPLSQGEELLINDNLRWPQWLNVTHGRYKAKTKLLSKAGGTQVMDSQWRVIALRQRHLWGLKLPLKLIIFLWMFQHEDLLDKTEQ